VAFVLRVAFPCVRGEEERKKGGCNIGFVHLTVLVIVSSIFEGLEEKK
jgi:hypothetical protein